ncbi:putative signal peptide protein [Puccinia sorghi]|uniref:Putative signal peptide protein n=1 Tax=Puccinia sorghi TaxID=27349 RepID=A0A0L6UPV6_9BASI|nr:putative signal peptide protein [Puccinia sorghi]
MCEVDVCAASALYIGVHSFVAYCWLQPTSAQESNNTDGAADKVYRAVTSTEP